MTRGRTIFFGCLWLLLATSHTALCNDETVRFNRDVRPILSDRCFHCHGPDADQRKADLRLDIAPQSADSSVLAPGNPNSSELLRRIISSDPEEQMPPAASKLEALSEAEVSVIRRWIEQGAKYEDHWSFIPLSTSPSTTGENSVSLDSIIETALQKRGLKIQPEADRNTLIRRLSFDLTGLPPEPEDITRFVEDSSENAYPAMVDRLLASQRFGERMAVDWLDLARYADSYGFQVDRERDVWPWRDWVISAFNRNLPFDQFITWQIAGDLLPEATDEQILATAFCRLHQQETEGGSVEEEYRVEYVSDRVQTFATAFLGLTFECARCHDHKFDPITQREYYQLFSMFQNIDEAGLYSYFTMSPPTPTLALPDETAKQKLLALESQIGSLETQLRGISERRTKEGSGWLSSVLESSGAGLKLTEDRKEMPLSGQLARFSFDVLDAGKFDNSENKDQPALLKGDNRQVAGVSGQAVEFTGDDAVELPIGNFSRHEPFSVSLWMKTPDEKARAVVFHRSRAWTDAASRGYELLLENGRLKWSLIHFWPGNAISIAAEKKFPVNEWVHVTVTYDGSSRASGLRIYENGIPIPVQVIKDRLTREITGGGGDNITLGERMRDRGFTLGTIDDFRVFSRELTGLDALAVVDPQKVGRVLSKPVDQLSGDERRILSEHGVASYDPEFIRIRSELNQKRSECFSAADSVREIMVMREMDEPKPAYVLFRGEYGERRDPVSAGTPAALSPFPADAPRNRLGLARWLTDPGHPLTARVTVNRIWQSLWGRGLVRTSEDFGNQGSRPLYPEALDWLASRFIQSGWDTKELIRTIVISRVYRQRSIADPRIMEEDPDNELLARGPSFRLPAEFIRDNALAVSGLLKDVRGGPPVFPYEMSEAFKPQTSANTDDVYRRSLYSSWRRTAPPPAMLAFDAPRRAVCTAKRERTNSPLQALILLNGVQFVEAARVLGETLHLENHGNLKAMTEQAFIRCLSRLPDPREVEITHRLYEEQLRHFQANAEDAEQLLKIGHRPRRSEIPAPEAAAATVLMQALLNHDECVVKR